MNLGKRGAGWRERGAVQPGGAGRRRRSLLRERWRGSRRQGAPSPAPPPCPGKTGLRVPWPAAPRTLPGRAPRRPAPPPRRVPVGGRDRGGGCVGRRAGGGGGGDVLGRLIENCEAEEKGGKVLCNAFSLPRRLLRAQSRLSPPCRARGAAAAPGAAPEPQAQPRLRRSSRPRWDSSQQQQQQQRAKQVRSR